MTFNTPNPRLVSNTPNLTMISNNPVSSKLSNTPNRRMGTSTRRVFSLMSMSSTSRNVANTPVLVEGENLKNTKA
jgi:hypothetical protein